MLGAGAGLPGTQRAVTNRRPGFAPGPIDVASQGAVSAAAAAAVGAADVAVVDAADAAAPRCLTIWDAAVFEREADPAAPEGADAVSRIITLAFRFRLRALG